MTHVEVPIPWEGLNVKQAYSAQPVKSSGDLLNCRPNDPANDRRRLARREGTNKYNSSRLSNNPVRFLGQIVTDGRKNTYAASAGSTDISITTPRAQESRGGCLDRQGNFYFLDGVSNITKVNTDGNVVWTFQPPIAEPQQQLCIPFVDSHDNLYVGVQAGGSQTTARVWRFSQESGTTTPVVQWQVEPGAYVRRILVRDDSVYLALNYPDRYGSYVVAYTGALNTGLTEAWRTPVAYPVNDLVLKPDGALLGCSLPFANRGLDPRFPSFTRKTLDAQFRDVLPDFDRRVWAWYEAQDIVDAGIADGEEVTLWPDKSGKNRGLFKSVRATTISSPIIKHTIMGGLPGVQFRGTIGTIFDEMQSQFTASLKAAYADGASGLWPNYENAKVCVVAVLRLQQDTGAPASGKQGIMYQNKIAAGTPETGQVSLKVGEDSAGLLADGYGTLYDFTDTTTGAGMGSLGNPYNFIFKQDGSSIHANVLDNNCATIVVSFILDGHNDSADNTKAHSLLRVNGKPWDRWVSSTPNGTVDPGYLGYAFGGGVLHFRGAIGSILVLRDYSSAPLGIIGHPFYPHAIWPQSAVTTHTATAHTTVTATTATELEKVEGIFAHRYGIAHLFPRAVQSGGAATAPTYPAPAAGFNPTTNYSGYFPHPYSLATTGGGGGAFLVWNGPPRATNAGRSEPFLMHSPQGIAWKLDAARGALQWCVTSTTGVEDGGGLGYSIACSNDGTIIYSCGPSLAGVTPTWDGSSTSLAETTSTVARAWVDKNGTKVDGYNTSTVIGQKAWIVQNQITFTGATFDGAFTLTGTFTGYVFQSGDVVRITGGTGVTPGIYTIASGNSTTLVLTTDPGAANADTAGTILPAWTTTDVKIGVDAYNNVYIPWAFASGTASTVKVYAREPDGSGASNVGRLLVSYADGTSPSGYCAVPVPAPPYRLGTVPPADFERNPTGSTLSAYARSEFVWLGVTQTGTLPNTTAGVMKVRLVTATPTGDPPRAQTLVQVVNGVVAKFTTSSMPAFAGPSTLATPQLSTASTYVAGAVAFNKLFLTDGEKYLYVDPINDTVLNYKATDGGKIPERCKLMVNWRGRIVVARGIDSPQQWHMSEMGNPFGWNQFPDPLTATRAISGVSARIGLAPDDVTCLIPYTDNVLIFGCDSTIWAMVGDPADEGSMAGFRQVSRTTGMAFGRPWALDPEGRIYFFGSRGGMYVMSPNSEPVSISNEQIDVLLRAVDLGTYRVEMAWDDNFNVLRLMFMGDANAVHYVWDRDNKGWWPDQMPYGVETVAVIDGDQADDRILLMGCADGYIRKWDKDETNDDGTAITSRFLIGPVTPQDARNKWRFRDLRVQMSDTQSGITLNVYESDLPDDKGTLRLTTTVLPGRNKGKPLSACGPYVWFEGTHSALGKRWALEAMSVEAFPVGRAHVV